MCLCVGGVIVSRARVCVLKGIGVRRGACMGEKGPVVGGGRELLAEACTLLGTAHLPGSGGAVLSSPSGAPIPRAPHVGPHCGVSLVQEWGVVRVPVAWTAAGPSWWRSRQELRCWTTLKVMASG